MKKILIVLLLVCFSFPVMAQLDPADLLCEDSDHYYSCLRDNRIAREEKDDSSSLYHDLNSNPYDTRKESKDDRYKKMPRGKSDDLSYERGKQNKSSESVLQDMMSTY